MNHLIEMKDLDVIAGLTVYENDPDLCECGKGPASDCAGTEGVCPMFPSADDIRFPSAEIRWHLGY